MDIFDSAMPHTRSADGCLLAEVFHPVRIRKEVSCRYSIAHAQVLVNEKSTPHRLLRSSEAYYIISGRGMMHIGNEHAEVHEGQLVFIPPGMVQWIQNTGSEDLTFLAICDPFWTEEDEIIGTNPELNTDTLDPFMLAAIEEAEHGRTEGGIPIGSVLVRNGQIIGRGHNQRVQNQNPMLHAEIDCLQNAGRIGSYQDCTLYSTLMPCYLCAGAVVQFRIPKVVVGESRSFSGAGEFLKAHGVSVIDLDLPQCKTMMASFIRESPELWDEDIGVSRHLTQS